MTKGELPAPRSAHTMTEVPGRPDCFLLFGGEASGKRFADLHRVEMGRAAAAWDRPCKECDDVSEAATAEWTREQPAGKPPAPRSGHAAVIFEGKLVVIGGENESGLLSDCHVLETGSMSWSTLGISLPSPVSNHCAVALPGVISSFCFSEPSIFIVGGRSLLPLQPARAGQPQSAEQPDAVPEYDVVAGITLLHRGRDGQLVWRTGVAVHDSPDAREMSAMAFDDEPTQGRRIFLFGGQGDTKGLVILQDLHTCDISSADIRPRPHVERVEPITGLAAGGEEISIHGTGLEGADAVVRFTKTGYRGQTKEVRGSLSGGVLLRCATPPWNQAKDGVEIHISIDGGPTVKCPATFSFIDPPPPPRPETPPPPPAPPPAEEEQTPADAPAASEPDEAPLPPEDASPAHTPTAPRTPPSEPAPAPAEAAPREPVLAPAAPEARGPTWRKEGDGAIPFSYKIRREREDSGMRWCRVWSD